MLRYTSYDDSDEDQNVDIKTLALKYPFPFVDFYAVPAELTLPRPGDGTVDDAVYAM